MNTALEAVKPMQNDDGELYVGIVPKITNYQKGKIYLYQEEKDAIEKSHRADIRRLGFTQLRDLLQSVLKKPDKIIGKKEKELFFQKRIDRSRSILVKVKKSGVGYKIVELMPIVHDRKLSSMNLNTYWEGEDPATESVRVQEPTKEMVEFFEKRTVIHIERVVSNIDIIIKAFPDLDIKNLEKRKTNHDASKYESEEYFPYIWNTGFHRLNNKGEKFKYPSGMEELIKKATKHHITVNKHHPEAHKSTSDMSEEDLAEMVADWAAMSQELGTGLKKWADDTISKKWKFSKEQNDFIYSLIDIFENPAIEYVIKPEDTEPLWYENGKGKRWYPDFEKGEGMNPPKGYIYQVSKFPNEVRANMLRSIVPDEVEKCKHPEEDIKKTYGWIDGMEGRECAKCNGTQVKKIKDPWPEKWDAEGSKDFLTMSTTWSETEVMALVNDCGYSLKDSIQLCTSMCGRCISSLLFDHNSKEAEFAEFSLDWFNENISCKHCEDHKMDPVTEDKLRRYRSNAPVYLKMLEPGIKNPSFAHEKGASKFEITKAKEEARKRAQKHYDLVEKRLAEYEKKLGKLWGTDLSKSPIATEKVSSFNFNDALGKPIAFLQKLIKEIVNSQSSQSKKWWDYYVRIRKKILKRLISIEEVKTAFNRILNNEQLIKEELSKLLVKDLLERVTGFPYDKKKQTLVNHIYQNMLTSFAQIGKSSFSYMMGGEDAFINAVKDKVESLTPENLEQEAVEYEKQLSKREAKIENLKNPQTLEDYEQFIHYFSKEKLSLEQLERYDELKAEKNLELQKAEEEKKTTIQAVQTGDTEFIIEPYTHTKNNVEMFNVTMSGRVDTDTYKELNRKARQLGGQGYSRWSKGFLFKDEDAAKKFSSINKESQDVSDIQAERKEQKQEGQVSKLREMAAKLEEGAIVERDRDRLMNTPKRAREGTSAIAHAEGNIAFAQTMRNLASAIESGESKFLGKIKTKADINDLYHLSSLAKHRFMQKEVYGKDYTHDQSEEIRNAPATQEQIKYAEYPYPGSHVDTFIRVAEAIENVPGLKSISKRMKYLHSLAVRAGKNVVEVRSEDDIDNLKKVVKAIEMKGKNQGDQLYNVKYQGERLKEDIKDYNRVKKMGIPDEETLRATLREFLQLKEAPKAEDPIKAKERDLIGTKIPGFFPTPDKVIKDDLLPKVDIQPGDKVLEPSGGSGKIADKIREQQPDANLTTIETNYSLRELLHLKGHKVSEDTDFLEHTEKYDKIVMNPPFENLQDIDHVKHAYSLLEPGGKMVSVMGEGPFFRKDKKAVEFREWLDEVGAEVEKLPEKSFQTKEAIRQTGVSTRIVTIKKPKEPRNQFAPIKIPDPFTNKAFNQLIPEVKKRIQKYLFENGVKLNKIGVKKFEKDLDKIGKYIGVSHDGLVHKAFGELRSTKVDIEIIEKEIEDILGKIHKIDKNYELGRSRAYRTTHNAEIGKLSDMLEDKRKSLKGLKGEIAVESVQVNLYFALGKPIEKLFELIDSFVFEQKQKKEILENPPSFIDPVLANIQSLDGVQQSYAEAYYLYTVGDGKEPKDYKSLTDKKKAELREMIDIPLYYSSKSQRERVVDLIKNEKKYIDIEGILNLGLKDYFAKNGIPEIGTIFTSDNRLITLKEVKQKGDVSDVVMGYQLNGIDKEFPLVDIPNKTAEKEAEPPKEDAKEPWQMTKSEALKLGGTEYDHRISIQEALSEGKKVPTNVLMDYPELVSTGREDYEERKDARIDRMEDRAAKAQAKSESHYQTSNQIGERFAFGQPILVGHHSEKKALRDRDRMWNQMGKSVEESEKAKHYTQKAASAASNTAISSDDPEAVIKLKEKVQKLEENQELMKKINTAWRKYKKNPDSLDKSDLDEVYKKRIRAYEPEYSWDKGPFPSYAITNNGANLRTTKKRLKDLIEKSQDETTTLYDENGIQIIDNVEENRVQIFFPEIPPKEIRKKLNSNGFNFSKRSGDVWQRKRSSWASQMALDIVKNMDVATEKVLSPDFTKAIGKSISLLQNMILDLLSSPLSNTLVLKGNKTVIETARGMEIEVQYMVVPQALLVASHSASGIRNKEFPDNFQNTSRDRMKAKLQNRDRSSHVSQYQADQMAKNIRPRLLGANPFASDGAMVTNSKLKTGKFIVLSGNGRSISLGIACSLKNDSADKYFDWLIKESKNFGINTEKIPLIHCPRLIRNVVKEMKSEELTKFVKQANKPSIQAPSSQEVAVEDASEISTDMLKLISPTRDGRIEGNSNASFISLFFQKVLENDPAEIGKMQTNDGKLTDEGVDRITRSVFMKAYGDPRLIDKLIRRGDDDSKKLTKGLLMAAPEMAKLGDNLAKANKLELDISSDIVKAVMELEEIRSEKGRTVEDVLSYITFDKGDIRNDPTIVVLLRTLEKIGIGYQGKPEKVKDFILQYINQADNAIQEDGMEGEFAGVFGTVEYEKDKMLTAAAKAIANESSEDIKPEDTEILLRLITNKKAARIVLEKLVGLDKDSHYQQLKKKNESNIATESTKDIDLSDALGKPIGYLAEKIKSIEMEMKSSKIDLRLEAAGKAKYDLFYPNKGEEGVYKERSIKEIFGFAQLRELDKEIPGYRKIINAEKKRIDEERREAEQAIIPEGDLKEGMTMEVVSIGRKWIKGVYPGKTFEYQIAKNKISEFFEIGKQYTFDAVVNIERSKYGTKATVTPIDSSKKEQFKVDNNEDEIKRWLGYVEDYVKRGDGYLYPKGMEKLKELGIEKYPESQKRLDTAIAKADKDSKKQEIKKLHKKAKDYLGYVNKHIHDYWYQNGEDKLTEFIGELDEAGEDTTGYKERLNELRNEFKSLEDKKESAKDEKLNSLNEIRDIINMPEVSEAQNRMKNIYQLWKKQGFLRSPDKSDFRGAQSIIEIAVDKLKEKGIHSKGLSELAYMNDNRLDRDVPGDVTLDDISDLTKDEPYSP